MSCSVLITRYRYDDITTYMHYWSEQIINQAIEKNLDNYDLKNSNAIRDKFESYLRRQSPTFIFVNGHGNSRELCGYDNQVLIDENSKLSTKLIYARSCDSATILGGHLTANGVEAFIGYNRKFTLCFLPAHNTRPLSDPLAKYFLEPSNLVATTILKGHSASTADSRSKDAMSKNVRKMLSSDSTDDEKYAARFLWANLKSQVLLGDGKSRA